MYQITKSTRHSKIIGNAGEALVCNWLSRSGWEASIIDHTGIDVLAYNPKLKLRIGITVKARTRNEGAEGDSVIIFPKGSREKLLEACRAFAAEPWIGVYVETKNYADLFLTSLKHYHDNYRRTSWSMSNETLRIYNQDSEIKHIHIKFDGIHWW